MPRRGRPFREPIPGERVPIAFRVTPTTKRALVQAANENGRSQSQEAEYRLQASFDEDRLLHRILAASGGKTGGAA